MSPRIFFLLIIGLSIHPPLQADIGSSYCMKTTITLTDGSIHKGYFSLLTYDLSISKDDQGYFYNGDKVMRLHSSVKASNHSIVISDKDYHFSNSVRKIMNDTIDLYDNIAIIFNPEYEEGRSAKETVGMVNSPKKIIKSAIRDFSVHEVYVGISINTRLVTEDLVWFQNKTALHIVAFSGSVYCTYQAFLFNNNKERVKSMLDLLEKLYLKEDAVSSSSEYRKLEKQINKLLEDLKKEKVIITSSCSC